MIERVAALRGRRRAIVEVPILSPRLSSYWLHLVTPVRAGVARPLVEGLRNPTVVRDDRIRQLLPRALMSFDAAARAALGQVRPTRRRSGPVSSKSTLASASMSVEEPRDETSPRVGEPPAGEARVARSRDLRARRLLEHEGGTARGDRRQPRQRDDAADDYGENAARPPSATGPRRPRPESRERC
jgi:hypothetical protein